MRRLFGSRRSEFGSFHFDGPIPSRTPGFAFDLHINGAWAAHRSPRAHHAPQAAAIDHALGIAQRVAAASLLTEVLSAEARLNALLGLPADSTDTPVRVLWANVRLTAEPEQIAAVNRQQRELHDLEVLNEHSRRRLHHARDLRDALMADPSLVMAAWFMNRPETVDEHSVERLERLVARVTAYAPNTAWVQVAHILQEVVADLSAEKRSHLVETLAHVVERYGYDEQALRLRSQVLSASEGSHDGNARETAPD